MRDKYVHYGCGHDAPARWRNFDASPTLQFERVPFIGKLYTKNNVRFPENVEFGDIVRGLPIPDNTCEGVYCSHVLEHLSLEDFRTALKNTYRILKNDSCFRLVVPDLEFSIKKYAEDSGEDSSIIFLRETSLGKEQRNRGITGFIRDWLGNSQHLWMWDYNSISRELKNIGFTKIRRASFSDSSNPMFTDVENKDRWLNCLGVECKKE
jgi:predicted SAM-dependent methyltransferase